MRVMSWARDSVQRLHHFHAEANTVREEDSKLEHGGKG
jgi:hypothetical protein